MTDTSSLDLASILMLTWEGKLAFPDVVGHAAQLEAIGQTPLSVVLYETWLRRNESKFAHFAQFNLGVALFNVGETDKAESAYRQAIELAPAFIQPHFNLGLVFERQGRHDEAVEQWRWVEEHASAEKPDERAILVSALNSIGRLQESRRKFGDAVAALEKSLLLNPEQSDTIHHWVFIRQKMCAWPVYADLGSVSPEQMKAATSALAMLSLSDDPQAQLAAAQSYSMRKIPKNLPVLAPKASYGHSKLRIAYLSSDFCLHPVSMLTAELFELHDRSKFEVYGFCWSPEDGSALRKRVMGAMDHFIQINALNDAEAAQLIRDNEIDILIDLHGQTRGARPVILAYRPALVQITYLGLPATTGLPCVDYVIADRFLIPEEYAQFYSEKPLYMPDIYQVSDRKRLCSPPPARKSCGLPETGFVFSSFNNNHKFTPEIFSVWMRILQRVPQSVLWLLADNEWAESNMREEAVSRGVDPARLVFAYRTAPEAYLARYLLADLFLDTYPFNAGTTANDALWMGLPVLTLAGRTFASRMAGSLLTSAGIDELITYNQQDYEDIAVDLAKSPKKCRDFRERLGEVREAGVLFDTLRFTRELELRLIELIDQDHAVR